MVAYGTKLSYQRALVRPKSSQIQSGTENDKMMGYEGKAGKEDANSKTAVLRPPC